MKCRQCETGICVVLNLSKKYERELQNADESLLLPSTELGILQTLHTEGKSLNASSIARELDCSYQLVGKRGKNLADRGLVERRKNEHRRRVFQMSDLAEKIYFTDTAVDRLDVPTE